jgi:hypothetical protein
MGSNPKQAIGLLLFFFGWVAIAAGAAMDGAILWIVIGIALLAGAAVVLIKAKPLEHIES